MGKLIIDFGIQISYYIFILLLDSKIKNLFIKKSLSNLKIKRRVYLSPKTAQSFLSIKPINIINLYVI